MNSDQSHLSEDTVSQSGWVFADLLVALSVIFLATISFVPDLGGNQVARPSGGAIELEPGKLVRSEGFSRLYKAISVDQLVADISEFRSSEGIPSAVDVVALQIVGSESESGKRPGILDALEFSIAIQNANVEEFGSAAISLESSARLQPGEVLVRAVFG